MELLRHASRLELGCYGILASIELEGKQLAMCHGDDPSLKRRLLDEQQHDYLFVGHAQECEDSKVGKTRVINPGTLEVAGKRSVAIVDLATDEVQFLSVDEAPAQQQQQQD